MTASTVQEALYNETTPLLADNGEPHIEVVAPKEYQYPAIPLLTRQQPQTHEPRESAPGDQDAGSTRPTEDSASVFGVLSLLFIGVFVSQADTSLVLATYGTIASEFNDLQNSSWLLSSYMLAMCMAQPLYGKLSDIFGRKTVLQVSYGGFALGSMLCGFCQSIPQLVVARSVQGLGGGGMVSLVSIIITDLVPLRDVASYRSYVNVVQTVGRSSGGAIGGFLAQGLGWRWTLAGQGPLTIFAMVLIAFRLDMTKPKKDHIDDEDESSSSTRGKLARIDFSGAGLLSFTVLAFLLVLDIGGEKVPWSSPVIFALIGAGIVGGTLFAIAEEYWAKEPIFPLHLLSRAGVVLPYAIYLLQSASQVALMFLLPLYFQVTKNATMGEAGVYMVPSIAGNAIGGLLTGAAIKRYGRYRAPSIIAALSSMFCFTLLLIFWNGDTTLGQSLFVFFGGFGTGIAMSSGFVALTAGVEKQEMAIASSGMYLSLSIGSMAGVCLASAVFMGTLRAGLEDVLVGHFPNGRDIADKALSDIAFVQSLTGELHRLVVGVYVDSFRAAFALCAGLAGMCFLAAVALRERRLQ